jgi:ribosomal protein L29
MSKLVLAAELAGTLALEIVEYVLRTVLRERLAAESRENVTEQDWSIVVEFVAFLLHFVNRAAHAAMPGNRFPFVDLCVVYSWQHVVERMVRSDDVLRGSLAEQLVSLSNEREREYAEYRFASQAGQSQRGELLWEFGKRIAQVEGRADDFYAAMEAMARAVTCIEALRIGTRVEEVRERLSVGS